MEHKKKVLKCNSLICLVLMVALLIMQFFPFWTVKGDNISLWEYVAFPIENSHVTEYFEQVISPDYDIRDILILPFGVLLCVVFGIVLGLFYRQKLAIPLLAGVCGGIGVYAYTAIGTYSMSKLWGLYLFLYLLLLGLGILSVLSYIRIRLAIRKA